MIWNAPRCAEVRCCTKVIQDGEIHFEDNGIGVVHGLFSLLGADGGIELATRARRASSFHTHTTP